MNTKLHFSSASAEWGTPRALFEELDKEFKFTLDVCADHWNAKCRNYFSREHDGLSKRWVTYGLHGDPTFASCWMNPPYGRDVTGEWVRKAHEEAQQGSCWVVALLPARTDTRWFHDIILKHKYEVRFLKGRLTFETALDDILGPADPAPFPSMVVVFYGG